MTKEKYQNGSVEKVCVICLDDMSSKPDDVSFGCNHTLHKVCFQKYMYYHYNTTTQNVLCPMCRTSHRTSIVSVVNQLLLLNELNE